MSIISKNLKDAVKQLGSCRVKLPSMSRSRLVTYILPLLILFLLTGTDASLLAQQAAQRTPVRDIQEAQSVVAKQASLVSEFDVNGLKVLIKKREGSQTVAAGLFI